MIVVEQREGLGFVGLSDLGWDDSTRFDKYADAGTPLPHQVFAYQEEGYKGARWAMVRGLNTSASAGYKNDSISSLRVGSGVKATLFQNSDGSGKSYAFDPGSNVATLKPFGMNDNTSLVTVESVAAVAPSHATPYAPSPGAPASAPAQARRRKLVVGGVVATGIVALGVGVWAVFK